MHLVGRIIRHFRWIREELFDTDVWIILDVGLFSPLHFRDILLFFTESRAPIEKTLKLLLTLFILSGLRTFASVLTFRFLFLTARIVFPDLVAIILI